MTSTVSLLSSQELHAEGASFWHWFKDVRDVLEGTGCPGEEVRQFVEAQRRAIEHNALSQPDFGYSKFVLSIAIALVGHQYSSTRRLLCTPDQGFPGTA
jgi:hypothetical protein